MEFSEVLARRHSCRQYADRQVEREKLAVCLEAGRLAPSGCNSQRWLFIAVDSPTLREQIASALCDPEMGLNGFAHQIPAFIAVVNHPPRRTTPKQEEIFRAFDHSLMDIGIAAQQICLAATDQGLGSVMMGWFERDKVKQVLGLPPQLEVALIIGLGYPAGEPAHRTVRYSPREIIRWNGYEKEGEA